VSDRILFVDDEQGVLDGYERLLRKDFYVSVARSGLQGLATIEEHGPFAVVVSDMRMPYMNGAEFLSQVRQRWPDSVRMLLTGYTDLSAAIAAVNEGNIFRFLTKPCAKEVLTDALNIGIVQYHSITAEKDVVKKAQNISHIALDRDALDICQWDNFESPTGLGGPSQARAYLDPQFAIDSPCYVILLKLTALHTLEQRYGEEASNDYLNIAAHLLVQSLRSDDRLFHWDRDVLMAVVQRQVSPAAMRMEIARLTSASREHVMEVNGRSIMIASPITFDLLPVSQFSTLNEMLAAFDVGPSGKI
jgi:FixJ family two-component response regulator